MATVPVSPTLSRHELPESDLAHKRAVGRLLGIMGRRTIFAIDPDELIGSDCTKAIQGYLDEAETRGGGLVLMPGDGGIYTADNLLIGTRTIFDLNGCTIQARVGATGAIIANKSVNSYAYTIRNGYLTGRGYSVHGVNLDHTAGAYPAGQAGPEPHLLDLRIDLCGTAFAVLVDAFHLVACLGAVLRGCYARQPKQDCYNFSGLTTDCLIVQCEAAVPSRDGFHLEQGYNCFNNLKIGECVRHSIYIAPGVVANSIGEAYLDNPGGVSLQLEGTENILTGLVINRGDGLAIVCTGARNKVEAVVRNQGGSGLTYACQVPAGATGNHLALQVASSGGSAMTTGIIDPLTDIARNEIAINGRLNQTPEVLDIRDDFLPEGIESGEIGELGWRSTGTTVAEVAGVSGHPGTIQIATAAAINSFGNLFLADTGAGSVLVPGDVAYFAWAVRVNVITNVDVRIGLGQNFGAAAGAGTSSVIFAFVSAASANWIVQTQNAGAFTNTTSTIAVGAGTWYYLEAIRQPGGNWEFWINGALVATHSTNLPAAALNVGAIITATAAAVKSLDVDLFKLRTRNLIKRY